jgi:shikimate kinase
MPGAGKTYWGRLLAEQFQLPFTDLDEYIERNQGNTIANIFATNGEQAFRDMETQALHDIVASNNEKNVIVACGGGTPAYNNNIIFMKMHGCVVYLQAEMEVLMNNISRKNIYRPLLNNADDMNGRLRQLMYEREKFYLQADHVVDVNDATLHNFKTIIDQCTNRH